MSGFPHLELKLKLQNTFVADGRGPKNSEQTQENLKKRNEHADNLDDQREKVDLFWNGYLIERKMKGFPDLPDENIIPVLLTVDQKTFDIESLKGFKIEIVSEEEDGIIIGAAADNFKSLREKIDQFKNEKRGGGGIAKLWSIDTGIRWKTEQILSQELSNKWDKIDDKKIYQVDLSIACYVKMPDKPSRAKGDSDERFDYKMSKWHEKLDIAIQEQENIALKRQTEFESFIEGYNANILSSYVEVKDKFASFSDSFSCRIEINGQGLKDLVLSYQYLFDVSEVEELELLSSNQEFEFEISDLELLPPDDNAPKICIIDSGIQENHKLLESAIEKGSSYNFIEQNTNTGDEVHNGGHGTKVAGAALYPVEIPKKGTLKLPFWIQNAKILNSQNSLPSTFPPPVLMEKIVEKYCKGTKIFNLSVNELSPCKTTHMSVWAAQIDKLSYEKDILFIISTGNINPKVHSISPFIPSLEKYISSGDSYPDYLFKNLSRISNPSQSSFALTVGSVCLNEYEDTDTKSFGKRNELSAFTKTGFGLWGMIKPDVVEYGGDFVREKLGKYPIIKENLKTSPELVKSTLHGGKGSGRDAVGTSFAAPKVASIAAAVQSILPNDSALMFRALVVHSARHPNGIFKKTELNHLRAFGYGIPDVVRATGNDQKRVTLIASNKILLNQAHIYTIEIPSELRRPGDDYEVLIEITLSYYALPRLTRKTTRSYLSKRLEWETSKFNEGFDIFKNRIIKTMAEESEEENTIKGEADRGIPWVIDKRKSWGKVKGVSRNDNTIQKDWALLRSNQLPNELSLAVVGKKGWDKNTDEKIPYAINVSLEFIEADITVYEKIKISNEANVEIET